MDIITITPQELYAKQQNGQTVDLLDVRTPIEYQEVHALPSRNVPWIR